MFKKPEQYNWNHETTRNHTNPLRTVRVFSCGFAVSQSFFCKVNFCCICEYGLEFPLFAGFTESGIGEKIMKYKVEISDESGNVCRVKLSIPFVIRTIDESNSSWRISDEGLIKYRGGSCSAERQYYASPTDLYLRRSNSWGIALYEFTDWATLVNESGTGTIRQHWCVTFVPYHITWVLL